MDRQQPQVAAIHRHGDIGSPALKTIIRPQSGQVFVTAPGDAVTDREPRRQVTETRRRPIPTGAAGIHGGTGRHRHVPTPRWKDAAGRRLVVDFLEGDHVRAKYHDLLRDRVVVGAFSRHAALSVRVVQMLQVPGRNAQLAAEARRGRHHHCQQKQQKQRGNRSQDNLCNREAPNRTQSASSLRMLLRNPLGFVWHYGLDWRAPESGDDPLVLDALAMGNLVRRTLDRALRTLEDDGGVAHASEQRIAAAVDGTAAEVARSWEADRAVPTPVIWRRTLDEVHALGSRALAFRDGDLADARAYGEVPFGGAKPKSDGAIPWDVEAPVAIPDTGFRIGGHIDRLDVSADGRHARVRDYKTGRVPKDDIVLDSGRELQRCLYAFAVKAMLGDGVAIAASLLYPREERDLRLDDPDAALRTLTGHLQAARASLASGGAVMGEDTGGAYDDLAFALPANAGAIYRPRKEAAATALLGDAARVWEAA